MSKPILEKFTRLQNEADRVANEMKAIQKDVDMVILDTIQNEVQKIKDCRQDRRQECTNLYNNLLYTVNKMSYEERKAELIKRLPEVDSSRKIKCSDPYEEVLCESLKINVVELYNKHDDNTFVLCDYRDHWYYK